MKNIKTISFVLIAVLLCSTSAIAGTAAPWDNAITRFVGLFQGRLALGIFLAIFAGAACALMKGGEMSDFVRKGLIATLIVSALAGITTLFNTLFGAAGVCI
jgi:type IV secretory pathway VirB2 component (pilin)